MKVHVGHENYIENNHIIAIIKPDSAPARKLKTIATKSEKLLDTTSGKKTRSLIIMTTGQVVLSSLTTTVMKDRCDNIEQLQIPKP